MFHASLRLVTAAVLFSTSSLGFSQELEFQFVGAKGSGRGVSCNKDNVQMISAGTNLSVIFENMNADMPANGPNRNLVESGVCTVSLNMTIPKGTYLTKSSMDVFGGVEKTKSGIASITSAMYLTLNPRSTSPALPGAGVYGLTLLSQKTFFPGQLVSEPLLQLSDSKLYSAAQQKVMCGWTKQKSVSIGVLLQVIVTGTRANQNQTTIVTLDGTDANFDIGMSTGNCH